MLLDTKLPHVRLRGYYLVRPSDTPANGASMRLGSEYAAAVPMAPGYTKRVETVSTQVAALWLLVLVDHGYMTRAGRPSDLLFVRTSKPAEVQS